MELNFHMKNSQITTTRGREGERERKAEREQSQIVENWKDEVA